MSENSLDALNHELAGCWPGQSGRTEKLSRAIVRDLRKSQIARIREQKNRTAAPIPAQGAVYYRTAGNAFYLARA